MKHTKLVVLPFVALTNNKMERIKLEGKGVMDSKNGDRQVSTTISKRK